MDKIGLAAWIVSESSLGIGLYALTAAALVYLARR